MKSGSMDVIFDIDGTLANGAHRQHHIRRVPKDWRAYQAEAHLDTCFSTLARLTRILWTSGCRIILCSGRNETERDVTTEWLHKHDVKFDIIYMRAKQDYRADDVIKGEMLDQMLVDGFHPELVFDDRKRVVQMWRLRGLLCAQVAEGDF